MVWRTGVAAGLVALSVMAAPTTASAQGEVTATLSVLSEPVDRIPAGAGAPEPGFNGMNLVEGDRIRAGVGGIALVTFLDGSTVTVLSSTDITVKQIGTPARTGIRILTHAGRVWARVVQVAGARSSLTLESNEYAATAHDGLIGAA